jgi:hypothetical protein
VEFILKSIIGEGTKIIRLEVTTTMSKKLNMHTNSFAKNKPVKSTDREAGLSDATSKEV